MRYYVIGGGGRRGSRDIHITHHECQKLYNYERREKVSYGRAHKSNLKLICLVSMSIGLQLKTNRRQHWPESYIVSRELGPMVGHELPGERWGLRDISSGDLQVDVIAGDFRLIEEIL